MPGEKELAVTDVSEGAAGPACRALVLPWLPAFPAVDGSLPFNSGGRLLTSQYPLHCVGVAGLLSVAHYQVV